MQIFLSFNFDMRNFGFLQQSGFSLYNFFFFLITDVAFFYSRVAGLILTSTIFS